MTYDLIIVGGGPAGVAAGVYASRKRLRTLFLTAEWGGQSTVSPDIQNWIGTPSLSGDALAQSLRTHLETYAGDIVDITIDRAAGVQRTPTGQYELHAASGKIYTCNAILVASGSKRRQLTVSGAAAFEHKGLTYCATCDGPLFAGQDVAVIGGGNAGFETAAQLLAYTKSVTLLHRGEQFKADPVTVEKVTKHPNMRAVLNAETTAITGDKFVSGLTYFDHTTKTEVSLPVTGIFIEIGMIPNTDFLGDIVERDEYGRITIDPWTQKTSAPHIWAAGDCTNIKYHQNNISAGDGVRALEDIYITLRTT